MDLQARNMPVIERADAGFKGFLNKVYSYMGGGLILSGLTAYLASTPPFIKLLYTFNPTTHTLEASGLGWLILFSPLALLLFQRIFLKNASVQTQGFIFWLFCALMGLSFGGVFLVYTAASLMQVFLITAGAFLALSYYGRTTKRDLSAWGSFLFMGLIGIILAMLVNMFFRSGMVSFVLSIVSVVVFAAFTAYDTNRLKMIYNNTTLTEEERQSLAISGALNLYIDFVNLFLQLLKIMGDRR